MSDLNLEIAPQVLEACRAGAEEAAAALGRALDGTFTVSVGDLGEFDAAAPLAALDGPGLAMLLKVGAVGLAVVLPESSGLLPEWYKKPDATGESKLATLAKELSMLVVPEALMVDDTNAKPVEDLAAALTRAGLTTGAATLSLSIVCGEQTGQLLLAWPLADPAKLFDMPPEAATEADYQSTVFEAATANDPLQELREKSTTSGRTTHRPRIRDLTQLPGYARSLLKIRVPVSVQLAAKKELVQEVITLAPGSIIKFDKGCEELLQMIVGEHTVAEGEAVKIGEKFGFRVTSMLFPPEHFVPARKRA